jgi:hypothetical protein
MVEEHKKSHLSPLKLKSKREKQKKTKTIHVGFKFWNMVSHLNSSTPVVQYPSSSFSNFSSLLRSQITGLEKLSRAGAAEIIGVFEKLPFVSNNLLCLAVINFLFLFNMAPLHLVP